MGIDQFFAGIWGSALTGAARGAIGGAFVVLAAACVAWLWRGIRTNNWAVGFPIKIVSTQTKADDNASGGASPSPDKKVSLKMVLGAVGLVAAGFMLGRMFTASSQPSGDLPAADSAAPFGPVDPSVNVPSVTAEIRKVQLDDGTVVDLDPRLNQKDRIRRLIAERPDLQVRYRLSCRANGNVLTCRPTSGDAGFDVVYPNAARSKDAAVAVVDRR